MSVAQIKPRAVAAPQAVVQISSGNHVIVGPLNAVGEEVGAFERLNAILTVKVMSWTDQTRSGPRDRHEVRIGNSVVRSFARIDEAQATAARYAEALRHVMLDEQELLIARVRDLVSGGAA